MAGGRATAEHEGRLARLRAALPAGRASLVTQPQNTFYLSGFAGGLTGARSALLVSKRSAVLWVDSRYLEEAQGSSSCPVSPWRDGRQELATELGRRRIREVEIDSAHVSHDDYLGLRSALRGISLKRGPGAVEALRSIKDEREVHSIRTAARACDAVLDGVLGWLAPGLTEREVAFKIVELLHRRGMDKTSFGIIVASGPRSSMPHAATGRRRIKAGDMVLMDFGARCREYCSDMTRTVVVGKAKGWQRRTYEAVLEAGELALGELEAGRKAADIDRVARKHLASRGLGAAFSHGLGHGVGLEIHESPTLGQKSRDVLRQGNVFSIEPGAYLPGKGGVRIEDLVWLGPRGVRVLTRAPKALLEV